VTLGLTVINPVLLYAGTALASIPVIIHLLNRLRFRRVVWAAMEFLLAAHRKNARRIRIEQIILLVIRTLIILLLAAAIARPVLEGLLAGLGESSVHRIIVIDDSFSMGAQYGVSVSGETAMKEARKTALWLMEGFDDHDAVSLVLAGSRRHGTHARLGPSFDHEQVVAEIENLRVSESTTDMVGALDEVRKIVAESKMARKIVYVLTDNSKVAWYDESGKDLRAVAAAITDNAALVVVDLSRSGQSNLAIRRLYPERAVITAGILSHFEVEVENLGDQRAEGVVVSMTVDGVDARPAKFGRVDPRATATRKWTYTFDTPGDHAIVASLKDSPTDAVAVDSKRYLAVNVKKAMNVLLVDGEPRAASGGNETDYLRLALDPRTRDEDRETIFLVKWVRDTEFAANQLDDTDVVFLANVASLRPTQTDVLKRFVADGGSLVVYLGDQVQAADYNRSLYDDGRGPLPAFVGPALGTTEPGKEDQYTTFDVRHFDHPALQEFKQVGGGAGLNVVRIYKYFQLKLPIDPKDTEVVLYFEDGNPAIVEKTFGRGRVVLSATSADTEWTNFPKLPGYLALVHELMDYVTPDMLWRYNRLVDAGTAIPVSAALRGRRLTLSKPDSTVDSQLQAESDGGRYVLRINDLGRSGIYTLEGEGFGKRTLAVNVDTAESNLDHLTRSDLTEALGGVPLVYAEGQTALAKVLEGQQSAGGWARNLLFAMLALLLVETFLAWFFNRGV